MAVPYQAAKAKRVTLDGSVNTEGPWAPWALSLVLSQGLDTDLSMKGPSGDDDVA
jgi:hypothetical protein